MVHVTLGVIVVLLSFGLYCVWNTMEQIRRVIAIACAQEVYEKLHSQQYVDMINKVYQIHKSAAATFVGSVLGVVSLALMWALYATGARMSDMGLVMFCGVIAYVAHRVWQMKQTPRWVAAWGQELYQLRLQLTVDACNKRLQSVEIMLEELKERAATDAFTYEDAGKMLLFEQERYQLMLTLDVAREKLSRTAR